MWIHASYLPFYFFCVYGCNLKESFPTLWSKLAQLAENNASLALDKDLVDEAWDAAAAHMVHYKQWIEMLYNKHVKFREFKKGELVRVAMDVRKRGQHWKDGRKVGKTIPNQEGTWQRSLQASNAWWEKGPHCLECHSLEEVLCLTKKFTWYLLVSFSSYHQSTSLFACLLF